MSTALDTCLDPQAMRPVMQQHLPECADGSRPVLRVRISKVRRSTSVRRQPHPLTLCYEVDLDRPGTEAPLTRRFYGQVFRDGARARTADARTVHVPELDLLLWPWPHDPGLPQLPTLLDPQQARPWWSSGADHVEALRHEPERRATLRYTRGAGTGQVEHLYAKTFCDARGADIHRRFCHFWMRAQALSTAPTVAEPLGYDAATHTVWQRAAAGRPLSVALLERPGTTLPAAAALALVHLHAAPLELASGPGRDAAHWLRELQRRQQKIARAAPESAERAARVVGALANAAERLPSSTATLIHGDCHPDQMWVDDQRIVLFDFDEFTVGDPMEDLAEFVTKLATVPGGSGFAAVMLATYARSLPEQFCRARLQWHLALQQVLQASRAFIFQVPQWRTELDRRLASAETLLTQENPTCLA